MERTERFYKIQQLLEHNAVVPKERFLKELGVSLATFKRDLEYLRDRFHAPIEFDAENGGYRYAKGKTFELPGLWFSADEVHALLTMHALLGDLDPGLLGEHIKPLMSRIESLLEAGDHSAKEVRKRIRVFQPAARKADVKHFEAVATAVLGRKRLKVRHYSRQRNDETDRDLSPQRLVCYKGTWYLDAWCHLRNELRSFSLETLRRVELLSTKAQTIAEKELDEFFASGYGIFSGKATKTAVLRFTPERARWVAAEVWHPNQQARTEKDGSYVLEVPYSDDRELIMDILRHGPEVEVLTPTALRGRVRQLHAQASGEVS